MKLILIFNVIIGLATYCSPLVSDSSVVTKDAKSETQGEVMLYTYVIVHGASGGGWDWRTMDELLTADGHTVYRPTLTGLGEKMQKAYDLDKAKAELGPTIRKIQQWKAQVEVQ